MSVDDAISLPPAERGIYCNRTLNLRSIRAIGFDMDYTLIHYRPEEWERRAYSHLRRRLVERGWPVGKHEFDAELITLGLIVDLELGNVVKANRFGYVKRAMHGTRLLAFDEQREAYAGALVDLREEPDPTGPDKRGAVLGPAGRVAEVLAAYREIGVAHFVLLPQARTLDDVQRTVAMLAEDVVPQLRS